MTTVFIGDIATETDFTVQTISATSKVVDSAVSLKSIIEDIKTLKYKNQVESFKSAVMLAQNPKDIKKEDYIISFLPHAWVQNRVKLKTATGEFQHDKWMSTGLIHLDLDKIPNNQMYNVIKKIDSLKPLARFKSPSGKGLKVFFQHDCGELDEYQRVHFRNALRRCIRDLLNSLELGSYYDYSPTNANRQCYLSIDPTAVYNAEHRLFKLSKGFKEIKELQEEDALLSDELKALVCTVKNNIVVTARDKHVADFMQRRIFACSGNGNTQSFALACELVRCGYSDADMHMQLQAFKSAVQGDWDTAGKIRAARNEVQMERNCYASETIQVDAKIDTARYNDILARKSIIKYDLNATSASMNFDVTNPLALSMINQRLPIQKDLVRSTDEFIEQAASIYQAVNVSKVVTVVENAGSGKSTTIGELAKLLSADMRYGKAEWNGMVFATNTRANRDAFANHNKMVGPINQYSNMPTGFTVVKGVTEIISDKATNPLASTRAAQLYEENFAVAEEDRVKVISTLKAEGLITESEALTIMKECKRNGAMLSDPFIAICHAKMLCGGLVTMFKDRIVVMDEMAADDVVALSQVDKAIAYGNVEVKVPAEQLQTEEEVGYFMEQISQRCNEDGEPVGGVVMLSAEKSLIRAFGTDLQPNMKLKSLFGNITVKHLGKPRTLVDSNLSIVVVDSLGNNTEGAGSVIATPRDKLAKALRAEGYYVICDGKRKDGSQIGDETIESCKGSNDLMTKKTAVLISNPHPFEIGMMMMRLSCDEATAISVIVSDKANQAIGRNVGYRNRGAECLLVVAAGVHSAEKTLTLDVISNNCFVVRKREEVEALPSKLQGVFSEYLNTDDNECFKVTACLYNSVFSTGEEVQAKDLKDVIREELKTNGVASTRIARDGLIRKTLLLLQHMGVTSKTKYIVANGKRTSSVVYSLAK
ncbi:BT4734/BF3469 family protein [Aeromonas hydrophila]|uniref:BT4734/BF3469 family protein n=1 Tax=Aeromonas hydrophila TaxID=644 RepID=UPI002929BA62|nr:hypothetical protein [Aeromonas hydrophila]